jgi:hypothetical protein
MRNGLRPINQGIPRTTGGNRHIFPIALPFDNGIDFGRDFFLWLIFPLHKMKTGEMGIIFKEIMLDIK